MHNQVTTNQIIPKRKGKQATNKTITCWAIQPPPNRTRIDNSNSPNVFFLHQNCTFINANNKN